MCAIVVTMEHSKKTSTMKIEKNLGSLETQELCLTERVKNSKREFEQILKVSFIKKNKK